MDFESLLYIHALKEHKFINKTAQILGISRQNLSSRLKKIEETIGFDIFIRSSNGLLLTQRGEKFVDDIEPIIEKYLKISKDFGLNENYYIASTFNSYCMECIYKVFPKLGINMSNINYTNSYAENILENIINGTINLGIIGVSIHEYEYIKNKLDLSQLDITTISKGYSCVGVMKDSSLYNKESIVAKDLQGKTFVKLKGLFEDNKYQYKKEQKSLNLEKNYKCIYANNLQELLLFLENENCYTMYSINNELIFKNFKINSLSLEDVNIETILLMIHKKNTSEYIKKFAYLILNYIKSESMES